jgi:two-component system NtrC family sensor kinase
VYSSENSQFDGRILVVDDDRFFRMLMEKILSDWGYTVELCSCGEEALERLLQPESPRLVLVDWMLPSIDGAEVCRKVKEAQSEKFVYVIIVTGHQEDRGAEIAFNADADDFILKPLNRSVLKTRIRAATRLLEYELKQESEREVLVQRVVAIEQLALERGQRLADSQRMAELGLVSAGIADEINNPLGFISANAQTFDRLWTQLNPLLERIEGDENGVSQFAKDEVPKMLQGIKNGVSRISRIVESLRYYCKPELGTKKNLQLVELLDMALESCAIQLNGVRVDFSRSALLSPISVNSNQLIQVFVNLIVNACHAMEGVNEKTLKISLNEQGSRQEISISDNGPGFSKEMIERIGTPFLTSKEVGKGLGLGMYICKSILKAHEASLMIENNPSGGATVKIIFYNQKTATPKINLEEISCH